jgi:hypothetical protein
VNCQVEERWLSALRESQGSVGSGHDEGRYSLFWDFSWLIGTRIKLPQYKQGDAGWKKGKLRFYTPARHPGISGEADQRFFTPDTF